ncbi:MAG: hypothetical protein JJT78_13975 [Leptospira sp.]|nr:hypothetical protein [Leptospira sp.]
MNDSLKNYPIISKYPDIFLNAICIYATIPLDILEEYKYDLPWTPLSANSNFPFDLDFIKKYEFFWDFRELTNNQAIKWNLALIESLKPRIDVRELSFNNKQGRTLEITEELLRKHSKKKLVAWTDNPDIKPEWKELYGLEIKEPIQYKGEPREDYRIGIENLDEYMRYRYGDFRVPGLIVPEFFDLYCKPILEVYGLEQVFENLFRPNDQRWFFWNPIRKDEYGLVPSFEETGDDMESPFDKMNPFLEPSRLFKLKAGSLKEGRERIKHVLEVDIPGRQVLLLVSEPVRDTLLDFRLPDCRFYPVTMVYKSLKTNIPYYILHLRNHSLWDSFDFDSKEVEFRFEAKKTKYPDFGSQEKIEYFFWNYPLDKQPKSTEDIYEFTRKENNKFDVSGNILPHCFELKIDLDLYVYNSKIIVSEFLKTTLDKKFLNHSTFYSASSLKIKIADDKYRNYSKSDVDKKLISENIKVELTKEAQYYIEKMERLQLEDKPFQRISGEDEFSEAERKFNVIFPKEFKSKYLSKKIKIPGFRLMAIDKFCIELGDYHYANTYPEVYKSVVIASADGGDTIHLLLEKDSDYMLSSKLYHFYHETGEYELVE